MKIIVCPDKFKGSLTAMEVCRAIEVGIKTSSPDSEVICHPLADGGDGMLEIMAENIGLDLVTVTVNDPLSRPIAASYGISLDGQTAYIEMSKASGLVILDEQERDCLQTTTFGTGELILDAITRGVTRVVLGMGGSATNDAGIGVAVALGYRFLDASGTELPAVGASLPKIAAIDDQGVIPELANLQVDLASDVQNPFYGRQGAAWTFGRQKGADDDAITLLDNGLQHLAKLVQDQYGKDLQHITGTGAAGGLGGGCIAFLNANMKSGIAMLIEATGLIDKLTGTDIIITGEGKLDEQTLGGKVIDGVVDVAAAREIPVAVLCGACTLSPEELEQAGIAYCDQVLKSGRSLEDAMRNGATYLTECARELMSEWGNDLSRHGAN